MTLGAKLLAVTIFVILFGGILAANSLGWWQTENTKEAAVFTGGEFAGQANPADIRGSYTFGDVQKNFDLPASLLAQAFGIITDDAQSFPVKNLETLYAESAEAGYEIGTASVRLFVAFYKGLPYDLTTDIYLPDSAAQILADRPLNEAQAAYLAAHTVAAMPAIENSQPGAAVPDGSEPVIQPGLDGTLEPETHEALNEFMVKGKTTFSEVLAWGVSDEVIETILGIPMPAARGVLIRDFCTENALSFEAIKLALQIEVDLVKK